MIMIPLVPISVATVGGYEAVLPSQDGIFRPGLILRAASINPHLSSHACPGVLNMTFQGSSKASNLGDGQQFDT